MTQLFPDGTPIDPWFTNYTKPTIDSLGKQYVITDYGIKDDGNIYTKQFQSLIDKISAEGGGVMVVPAGTYMTGSIFFKQGVNLYIQQDGVIKGSDDISDYKVMDTRIEGENCKYFAALINVDSVDGTVLLGPGKIDGNGLRAWKAFWIRRQWNPACTNKDEQRPRLVYISNSSNITVADLSLHNSHFWTNHLYKSHHIRYINCNIYSPSDDQAVKAPSTDAIDIDVCTDVHVTGCYLAVNDDSTVLKGGKGPWADTLPENGMNERIIIEDCEYGYCHGILTCGSESIHNRNVILRNVHVKESRNFLWLKMRPDTPQNYEYITIENVKVDKVHSFLTIHPWTQFYDLKDRKDIPLSYADHITIKDVTCNCSIYFDVEPDESQYILSNFNFANIKVTCNQIGMDEHADLDSVTIHGFNRENVEINLVKTNEKIKTSAMPD